MSDETASEDPRDDLARGMDRWQVECTVKLMSDYGHPWDRAMHLAAISRAMLEADLRKPMPLIVLTGV